MIETEFRVADEIDYSKGYRRGNLENDGKHKN